ncbi:MAG: Uma2 family endonuclease [Polyangiaceae bacterium]|nr:Uma2 family endonuclease [Polyangiaceae bacterium]
MLEDGVITADEPLELLEGDLVVVSPQGPQHTSRTALVGNLLRVAYGADHVREEKPLVASPTHMPEPDLAVVRGAHQDYAERHPRVDEAVLVVEIAWTSLDEDHRKLPGYARGGAPVVWVLDLQARRLEEHSGPLADGSYKTSRILTAEEHIAPPTLNLSWLVADLVGVV